MELQSEGVSACARPGWFGSSQLSRFGTHFRQPMDDEWRRSLRSKGNLGPQEHCHDAAVCPSFARISTGNGRSNGSNLGQARCRFDKDASSTRIWEYTQNPFSHTTPTDLAGSKYPHAMADLPSLSAPQAVPFSLDARWGPTRHQFRAKFKLQWPSGSLGSGP